MSFTNSRIFNRIIVPGSFIASAYGAVTIYKESKYKKCPSNDRMDDKTVLITGANSGIGYETARELANRGATIVMGCRHMGRCESAARRLRSETNNKHIVCRFLDLANLDSVQEFATNLRQELDRIDVLINNAGVMKPRLPKATPKTDDGFDRQLGINHIGHFLLTNLLMSLMMNDDVIPGRIVNVTSVAHRMGKIDLDDVNRTGNDVTMEEDERLTELYYQSKLANVCFTNQLNKMIELGELTNVVANCVHPGVASTNISRYSNVPFYAVGQAFFEPVKFVLLRTARQAAQTSIYLASDEEIGKTSGFYFEDCGEVKEATCDVCDDDVSDKLWSMTSQWTELKRRSEKIRMIEDEEKKKVLEKVEENSEVGESSEDEKVSTKQEEDDTTKTDIVTSPSDDAQQVTSQQVTSQQVTSPQAQVEQQADV